MDYEIDQSGKVEDTARHTIIAFSNDRRGAILLSAKDKRLLQAIYRENKKPRVFAFQTFAALVYLLLEKHCVDGNTIVIDSEYQAQESLIKSYLLQLIRKRKRLTLDAGNLVFRLVGKRSAAHKLAIEHYRRKQADSVAKVEEILALVILYER